MYTLIMKQWNFNSIEKINIYYKSLNAKMEEVENIKYKVPMSGDTGKDFEKNNGLQGLINRIKNLEWITPTLVKNYQKMLEALVESINKLASYVNM